MSGASRAFVYSFAGALLCNFSLHLAESPRRARSISTPSTMLDVGLKTTREMDVTDAQSFFHAFPLLSQVFPHVLDPPLAAHMVEPNQVQCWTLA